MLKDQVWKIIFFFHIKKPKKNIFQTFPDWMANIFPILSKTG